MNRILVVDDDLSILKVIKMRLEAEGFEVTVVEDVQQAMRSIEESEFDLAVVDLKLARANGIELMEAIHAVDPELPVLILTAHGTIESAVEAMKKGAHSYLTKPFDYRELLLQIRNGIEKGHLSREVERLRSFVRQGQVEFDNIIGQSDSMKRLFELVALAAESDSNIYIQGESGTGKGIIAKALHNASPRKDKPFVAINCAAIPETLIESELFGFEKGAFTGATLNKKGLFVQAHGGTIFLDEIAEIPLPMQGKLLKALEDKEFYPLGSQRSVKVDLRIIAASNRELEKELETGAFRRDLFYRIHVIPIKIPPLRERKEDIPHLVAYFLDKFRTRMSKEIKGLSPQALNKILQYSWPGNVRELENAIECAVVMCTDPIISDSLILPTQEEAANSLKSFKESRREFEKKYLTQLMEISKGNVSQAAKLAGKYRADLYEMLERHKIRPPEFRQGRRE
ncbi:MAG: sigma-54 dependent transcriptional regulator [Syntrophales bacterium]|nr:sigma-54 dependent transcriptional regulator [Syntrophales bacterium]MDD5234083.1 sigma-54 dependent transcriptional regulator [Syntrophales bacterium]MDD5532313.1 sigma-54 dependent transcriptional regulator [Syntrophales bacterium]HPL64389.1 sigma-54 dependent transcriptional regulator [Syntrophales bacterium]